MFECCVVRNDFFRHIAYMKFYIFLVALLVVTTTSNFAQSSMVHNRLRLIMNGKANEVRKELPDLIKEFPDDPGVMFLNGILMEDATKALSVYEQITREFPQSEWADDAQWRIVQYYALKRDTTRAHRELGMYKRNYPMSEFLIHAIDIVKATVGEPIVTTTPPEVKKPAPDKTSEKSITPTSPKSKAIDIAPTTDDKKQPEKTTPATNAKANAAGSAGKKWGLQIGVYSTRQTAEDEAKKYSEQKLRVEIVDKGDSKFAVIIGNYNTRESAEKSKEVVQAQCQCTPYIMEK